MESIVAEEWRPVKGYEELYEVSNLGRVKSLARTVKYSNSKTYNYKEKILKGWTNVQGYETVCLYKNNKKKTIAIHIIVAESFLSPCPGKHETTLKGFTVDHIDDDKSNNRASNLQWLYNIENIKKSNSKRAMPKGEENGYSKLKEDDVLKILQDDRLCSLIAKDYSVSKSTIERIKNNLTWKHLERKNKNTKPKPKKRSLLNLTDEDIYNIRCDFRNYEDIARDYNISTTRVSRIIKNQEWTHLEHPCLEKQLTARKIRKCKLSNKEKIEIYTSNLSIKDLSVKFNVSTATISRIKRECKNARM